MLLKDYFDERVQTANLCQPYRIFKEGKEIEENDYNLSVSTYVEKADTREKIDIVELNKEIDEIVASEQVLRDEINKIISGIEV